MIGELASLVARHDKDLYRGDGNGNPGVIARVHYNAGEHHKLEARVRKTEEAIGKMEIQWAKLYAYVSASIIVGAALGKVIDHYWR